ncbi:MAG: nickel-responsive transcriptional regulator NikR [Elusimicrobiota bacterium]
MSDIKRFGVSLNKKLLDKFDKYIAEKGYPTRSKAIGDLIRKQLRDIYIKEGETGSGTVTLVYNHHKRQLVDKLTDIQHSYGNLIICSQHVHLDNHNCLEIIVVEGPYEKIEKLADELRAVKGVKHARLVMASTKKELE